MRSAFLYITGILIGLVLIAWTIWGWPDSVAVPDDRGSIDIVVQHPLKDKDDVSDLISSSRQNAITKAVQEVSPAVVGINVISVREYRYRHPFYNDPFFRGLFPDQVYREKVENLGSGFLITEDGYILTNEHVVHGAAQVIVTTTDGNKYDAEIVGFDYDSDVALLKIDGSDLPHVRFGNSDEIIIGEWSIAIGNPFGLFSIHSQPTVTVGVISAIDRDFDRNDEHRLYQDMIQTDAAINRGNSGGPLVNSLGELIGMNTMIFTETGGSIGLGFAIPSNKLLANYEELRARVEIDRDYWIGLEIQDVNRIVAMSLGLPEIGGVIVTEVEKGSPADKAGFEPVDVILGINGNKVNDVRSAQYILRNSDLRVGDKIELSVFREGRTEKMVIKLLKK